VREDKRQSGLKGAKGVILAIAEIGRQYLEIHLRLAFSDRLNAVAKMTCPPVGQIVTIDARNDKVPQRHFFHHPGQSRRLGGIWRCRLAAGYRAEFAVSRADVAKNQDRRCPPCPAFAAIRTISVAAYCLQAQRIEYPLGMPEPGACG
jgi:hypothetical protein